MNTVTGQILADVDVQAVLEFMQSHVSTSRLVSVADALPQMARLLWSKYQQEPCQALMLVPDSLTNGLQPDASESCLAGLCVDDGSEAVTGVN